MSRSGGSLCGHSKGVSPVDMGMSGKVAVIRLCCMIVASAGVRPQRARIACPGTQERRADYRWSCGQEQGHAWQ